MSDVEIVAVEEAAANKEAARRVVELDTASLEALRDAIHTHLVEHYDYESGVEYRGVIKKLNGLAQLNTLVKGEPMVERYPEAAWDYLIESHNLCVDELEHNPKNPAPIEEAKQRYSDALNFVLSLEF